VLEGGAMVSFRTRLNSRNLRSETRPSAADIGVIWDLIPIEVAQNAQFRNGRLLRRCDRITATR
jgi:hypothetical protein